MKAKYDAVDREPRMIDFAADVEKIRHLIALVVLLPPPYPVRSFEMEHLKWNILNRLPKMDYLRWTLKE